MVFSASSLLKFNNIHDNVLIHVIFRLVWLNYHYDHRLCPGVYALVLDLYVWYKKGNSLKIISKSPWKRHQITGVGPDH